MTETTSAGKPLSRSRAVLICLFAVYAVLTLIGAFSHEIWYDEAQAWNIARDNDIAGIIEQIQFEGHPPLWFVLLHIFAASGCPVQVMPFISWTVSAVTMALFLWKAPLSPVFKGLVLFSGGSMFYLSVQSRIYCLIALFLVLMAILYPKRNERPLLFGLLVALMANTHAMMSGFIGIMGIFMIIDLFRLWKSSTTKMNIMRLAGLAISGIGVLCMVLPLLTALNKVGSAPMSLSEDSLLTMLIRVFACFPDITLNAVFDGNGGLMNTELLSAFKLLGALVLLLAYIELRHYRRAFVAALFFTGFYMIVCCIMWYTLPARAFCFLFVLVFCFWTGKENEAPVCREPKLLSMDISAAGRKILEKLWRADQKFDRNFCALLCVFYAATIPMGMFVLGADYFQDYSQSKNAADFIRENLPEDSVIVVKNEIFSHVGAYLPGYKFYSLNYSEYETYSFQVKPDGHVAPSREPEELDYRKSYEDLKDIEHLYLLDFDIQPDNPGEEMLFKAEGTLLGAGNLPDSNIMIFTYHPDLQLIPRIEKYQSE